MANDVLTVEYSARTTFTKSDCRTAYAADKKISLEQDIAL
jgi:hypothetical protein